MERRTVSETKPVCPEERQETYTVRTGRGPGNVYVREDGSCGNEVIRVHDAGVQGVQRRVYSEVVPPEGIDGINIFVRTRTKSTETL